ncbi:MAG: hypothetical protein EAS52_11580 [Parapedobacter sp.]|nr:MAG: hypothetical protein EAS52_11580 [Parapedobacter sp.]
MIKISVILIFLTPILLEPVQLIHFKGGETRLAFWLEAEDFVRQQTAAGNNVWTAEDYASLTNTQKNWIDSLSEGDNPYLTGNRASSAWGSNWEFATDLATNSPGEPAAYDFNLTTHWLSPKGTDGIGQRISFVFAPAYGSQIKRVKFFPGNMRTPTLWKSYSRPEKVKLTINGQTVTVLQLKDEMACQVFDIPMTATYDAEQEITVDVEILSVYRGTTFKETAVSEINFDGTSVL